MVQLLELLDLTEIDTDLFTAATPDTKIQRIFGGQVAAQTLTAAMLTVEPDRLVHSMHANFLRPGDPTGPIEFEVGRTRDGRSFSSRRVSARQQGTEIFTMAASFHVVEDGPDHQSDMPQVPTPDEVEHVLPEMRKRGIPWILDMFPGYDSVDYRLVEPLDLLASKKSNHLQAWVKAKDALPDNPTVHAGVLAFMSDIALLFPTILPHMPSLDAKFQIASLDHAMWFHRPFKADEWLLYDVNSCSASGGRGISKGSIYSQDGRLVATAMQEGLVRPLTENGKQGKANYSKGLDSQGRPM